MEKIISPLVVHLEALLMPNGEVLHYGKSLGFVDKRQMELVEAGATKLSKGNEIVIGVGKGVCA